MQIPAFGQFVFGGFDLPGVRGRLLGERPFSFFRRRQLLGELRFAGRQLGKLPLLLHDRLLHGGQPRFARLHLAGERGRALQLGDILLAVRFGLVPGGIVFVSEASQMLIASTWIVSRGTAKIVNVPVAACPA